MTKSWSGVFGMVAVTITSITVAGFLSNSTTAQTAVHTPHEVGRYQLSAFGHSATDKIDSRHGVYIIDTRSGKLFLSTNGGKPAEIGSIEK